MRYHETPNLGVMGSSPMLGQNLFVCIFVCLAQITNYLKNYKQRGSRQRKSGTCIFILYPCLRPNNPENMADIFWSINPASVEASQQLGKLRRTLMATYCLSSLQETPRNDMTCNCHRYCRGKITAEREKQSKNKQTNKKHYRFSSSYIRVKWGQFILQKKKMFKNRSHWFGP